MKGSKGLRIGAAAATLALGVQMFGSLAAGPGADAHNGAVQATTWVHVRSEPTTSSRSLAVLNPGQKVTASGATNGWTTISWNGKQAYVYSQYLSGGSSSGSVVSGSTTGTATTTSALNVRTGPGTSYRSVTVVAKGTKLELTGRTSGDWRQVKHGGADRWVHGRYVTTGSVDPSSGSAAQGSVQTTASNLHIRAGASTSSQSITLVKRGTILTTTGATKSGFTEVLWQGQRRWASSQYLKAVSSSTTNPSPDLGGLPATSDRWTTGEVHIWTASSGSGYSAVVQRGTKLAATSTVQNGRTQIVYNGAIRWATSRLLSATQPTSADGIHAPGSTWDLASPPITGGPRGKDLNKGWSSGMERTNPHIQRISADAWQRFPEIITHYGWRRDPYPDHPAGRAVDLMIPYYKTNKAYGTMVAEYYKKHAKELNISYIIWDQKIWNIARDSEGWRPMANRGSDSANHLDHIHINSK